MRVAQIRAAIKALGNITARRTGEGSEIRVTYTSAAMPDATRREDVASYCSDWEEALGTARHMAASLYPDPSPGAPMPAELRRIFKS